MGSLVLKVSSISYRLFTRRSYSSLPLNTTCIAVMLPSALIIKSLYIGLLIISSLASFKSIPSVVKSFRLSDTSVRLTFGWKNIGASSNDKTESTPSIFDNFCSISSRVDNASLVNNSLLGS